MLAVCEPSEFALAVISEDVKTLTQIPGIGAKSAQRIILELKDKIKKQDIETKGNEQKQELNKVIKDNENIDEAISALQVLGYSRKEIEKAFEKTSLDGLSVEDMIRRGLSLLGK